MIERKEKLKEQGEPCNDLDEASGRYNRENLELQKEKMNILEPRIDIMNELRKKELITWMKQE